MIGLARQTKFLIRKSKFTISSFLDLAPTRPRLVKLMKLKFENKEIELVDVWFNYLYPYLIRFSLSKKIGIEWKNGIIFISKEDQLDFYRLLKNILRELLFECYMEPTQKERSKHSSRYQKIDFDGKTYILNYRTDIVGIIGYALNYLIRETQISI